MDEANKMLSKHGAMAWYPPFFAMTDGKGRTMQVNLCDYPAANGECSDGRKAIR